MKSIPNIDPVTRREAAKILGSASLGALIATLSLPWQSPPPMALLHSPRDLQRRPNGWH